MDDRGIIDLYFARDERAIKETDAKYGKLCHRIAYNILGCAEDSEECVNDTYVGVWNSVPPARPSNFLAFVCGITRNLSLKRIESMTRQKRAGGITASIDELADILPDERIADGVGEGDISRAISDFLRAEKQDVRNVFIRKYYFFDSTAEIAKRYGFTESKVRNMLYHTRNKLREYLIREGIEI